MAVNTEQYADLRRRLEEEKSHLEADVQAEGEAKQAYTADIADEDRSYGNHMADDASGTYEQERHATLQRSMASLLEEVNGALQRMDEGTYGTCEVCGKPIPIERLEALPHATRCIEDQAREDRRR